MRGLVFCLLLGFCAQPAFAVNDWGFANCAAGSQATDSTLICFDFDASLSPTGTTFTVTAPSALACLRTDYDQEGVSTTGTSPATAIVRYCSHGDQSSAALCGVQACTQAGCKLTGANGVLSVQLACVVLGPGSYRVDFPSLPDSPDVGLFSVQGGK